MVLAASTWHDRLMLVGCGPIPAYPRLTFEQCRVEVSARNRGEEHPVQLQPHKRNWEELAEVDPLWAILSNSKRQHGGWDLDEFFAAGEREVAGVMDTLQHLQLHVGDNTLLDFGCGVGRLTRAFASRFQTCYGVDISERMIEGAGRLNKDYANCLFRVNTVDNLRLFPDDSFDMIYTNLVLQHVPDRAIIKSYIREFVRALNPGGVAVFQLPSYISPRHQLQPRRRIYTLLRSAGLPHTLLYNKFGLNPIKMNFIPAQEVISTVQSAGGRVNFVDTKQTPQYQSSTYFVTRPAAMS
jgi:SAM-dependent methyltransferase